MKRRRKITLEIVALVCAGILALLSALSLMDSKSDAEVLALLFASVGAGAALANLIRDIREDRKRDRETC